jgi:NAD(P)-dependent dehydrogenase (short-subunit alcohol dehydrogenase family)
VVDAQMRAPLLEGRIAVVTGGAAGIGGGVTRRLASEGATVVVNDIDEALLDSIVNEVESTGGRIVPAPGDIRDPETVARLAAVAGSIDDDRIDVLVNNVGGFRPTGAFFKAGEENWQAMYAINLEHVFRCTKAIAPKMMAKGRGSIVNVSTVEAIRAMPGMPVYSAFNAGIIAFSKSMAVDLGRYGVRVNVIAPDLADTLATPADVQLNGRSPAMTAHWSPVGRYGHPDEYGNVVLFLASDLSSFMTGSVLPVDGGTLAAGGWYLRMDKKRFTQSPEAP